jgi:hypothetical protein
MEEITYRTATESDKDQLRHLWDICFEDTTQFVDFFFKHRFLPEFTTCACDKGKIVGAMYSLPVDLWIRKKRIRSAIIAGVGTHPDHRGKGIMKGMFLFHMPLMKSKGILLVTYHPVNFDIYRSLGHLACSDSLKIEYSSDFSPEKGNTIQIFGLKDISEIQESNMLNIYTKKASRYSGTVARSAEDFRLKIKDYCASDAKFILDENRGYCIFFEGPEKIVCEETVMLKDSILEDILKTFSGKTLLLRLPPDHKKEGNSILVPQNAIGTSDISALVKELDLATFIGEQSCKDIAVEIKDQFLKSNDVVIDLTGDRRDTAPSLSIGIGDFVRFLCGYTAAEYLIESGNRNLREKLSPMDHPANRPACWTIDEY